MLRRRIVPCLDVAAGRVVKGVNFLDLRDMGDPVALALRYEEQGADEVVFLDITASHEDRRTTYDMIERCASKLSIPLTVGGGIRSPEDMHRALLAGADKVGVNTAALSNAELITACSKRFGAQCVVVAVDAKRVSEPGEPGRWNVFTHGGRRDTGKDALAWCKEAEARGAGEILLTSMDGDGTKAGYDLELTRAVSDAVGIPVIASGGVGHPDDLAAGLRAGADAALAASIFHEGTFTVGEAKRIVAAHGLPVREVLP